MKIETGPERPAGVEKHELLRGGVYAPIRYNVVDSDDAFMVSHEDTNLAIGLKFGTIYDIKRDFDHDRRFFHYPNAKVVLE